MLVELHSASEHIFVELLFHYVQGYWHLTVHLANVHLAIGINELNAMAYSGRSKLGETRLASSPSNVKGRGLSSSAPYDCSLAGEGANGNDDCSTLGRYTEAEGSTDVSSPRSSPSSLTL